MVPDPSGAHRYYRWFGIRHHVGLVGQIRARKRRCKYFLVCSDTKVRVKNYDGETAFSHSIEYAGCIRKYT